MQSSVRDGTLKGKGWLSSIIGNKPQRKTVVARPSEGPEFKVVKQSTKVLEPGMQASVLNTDKFKINDYL